MFDLRRFKDNIACITPSGEHLPYGGLQELSESIRSRLEPHRLVFCLCGNTIESLAGYVSFVDNDDATLMLDSHMEPAAFRTLFDTYRPRYVWAPEAFAVPDGAESVLAENGYVLWEFAANDTPVNENLSVLLTTSGSTGSPKLVRLSKMNLESNARSIAEYLHITSDERPVTGLPMYYSFGLSVVNSHLLMGATLLLTPASYIEREFWQFANDNGFTSFSGVPYTYEIMKKLKLWKLPMPTLRTLTQAGGKLSNELLQFFIEKYEPQGVKFYLMYGQTEATARMSYLDPAYGVTKLGSIGKGIPGGTLSLVDDEGRVIEEADNVGELVYEGPNVSLGYAECAADLMKGDENRGVLHTGDLAYRDEDGFYFIAGRKKRFLKLFGNRVSLDYVEHLLKDRLKECACVGDDSRLIVYTTDTDHNDEEIIDFLVRRTKIVRTVFSIRHIDRLPRSETGKILYKALSVD
ncbi:MAG: AMP-binding protein [Bacteroidales bacterium]|nr:AMP-binding protein [Bacteroidales bacterium]